MVKLAASSSHQSLVMPLERERERERENGEKKSTCYWAIPINYQTSSSKRGQFITFDEAKSWMQVRARVRGCEQHKT